MNPIRVLLLALATSSCAPRGEGCEPEEPRTLHDDVREASGVALSRAHDDVLWTHNDSEGGNAIFALDLEGNPLRRVELSGAHNRDWEDIAVAPCPAGGPDGDCVFVADIGDNRATREGVGIWIAAEPDPRAVGGADAVFQRLLYPDGPRDAEAIAILDDGSVLIVSKGREHQVAVYRSAPLAWPDLDAEPVELRLAQRLSSEPVDLPDQVTGAAAADGVVAVRRYASLQFYRLEADTLAAVLPEPVALDSLAEPQGEGVTLDAAGTVYLISEAGPQAVAPRLTILRCRLP